jgi:uncharacterized protein with HEPN domain
MTLREDRLRLRHMLGASREAVELIAGLSQAEVISNRVLTLALVRLLEVVGEAAARIMPETQVQSTAIPWSQIVSLRNRLIHGYDSVDFDILWQILTRDLPSLIASPEELLAKAE